MAAGADLDLVYAFDVEDEDGARDLEVPDDVPKLSAAIAELGARLVVIDPLNAHLSASTDSWKDHGIRKAVAPLARMADECDTAVVLVVHLNKQKGGDPLYRPGGSIGNVGAARSLLGFGRDPDDEDGPRRLLGQLKSNWGVLATTQVYELRAETVLAGEEVIDTSRLVFVEESDADAASAFGVPRQTEARGADAEEAIGEQLADLQPHPSREVKSAVMAELDVSEPTVSVPRTGWPSAASSSSTRAASRAGRPGSSSSTRSAPARSRAARSASPRARRCAVGSTPFQSVTRL